MGTQTGGGGGGNYIGMLDGSQGIFQGTLSSLAIGVISDGSSSGNTTGIMNLVSSVVGGVPMCHGAGGMAGHVAFGARTGGAPIILGVLLLMMALFFSDSIATLFAVFPRPILGVILFLAGLQLALGSCDLSKNKAERFISLITAAFSIWNVAVAFLMGLALAYLQRRNRLRL